MKPNLLIKKYDLHFYMNVEMYLRNRGYSYLGLGGYRMVFSEHVVYPRSVIKIPRGQDGFEHNICEAYVYHKYRNRSDRYGIFYAPCRLLTSGCLLMSFVKEIDYHHLPDWAHKVDQYQVGKFRGKFVAYDGGCDISGQDRQESLEWAGVRSVL